MKTYLTSMLMLLAVSATSQNLTSIESVEYDPVNGRYLVSNGSSIIEVNGDGDPVGYFGTAAADYGMEVMGNVLYAIDNGSIKGFSLTDGSQVSTTNIPGSGFLNGMASDGVNRLWVTDFSDKKIYEITVDDEGNGSVSTLIDNTVVTPNGITYDGANSRLVFVTWTFSATIRAVDLNTLEVTILATTSTTNIDGVDHDGNGNFYIASWTPSQIRHYWNEFTEWEVVTTPTLMSPADICYAVENDTLAIPNTGTDDVFFIGFGANSISENYIEDALVVTPNPATESPSVYFILDKEETCDIRILSATGQEVARVFQGSLPAGRNRVILDGTILAPGTYEVVLTTPEGRRTTPFVFTH